MTIHDQSYKHWDGRLEPRLLRWLPMVPYQLRMTLTKRLIWLLLFLSFVPTIVFALMIYAGSPKGPVGQNSEMLFEMVGIARRANRGLARAQQFIDTSRPLAERYLEGARRGFSLFLIYFQSFFVLITCSVVGSGLIAKDMRSNAIEIYLTKPLTRTDYVLGKLTIIGAFVFLVTFVPSMIVFLVASALLPGFFTAAWTVLPSLLAACLIASAVNGIVILGLSSLTKSGRFASVIWFSLCFLSWVIGKVLSVITENGWFNLISYRSNFQFVFDAIFRIEDSRLNRDVVEVVGPTGPALVLLGYTIGAIVILRTTIQGREYRA